MTRATVISRLKALLPSSIFVRNISVLAGSTVGAQAILILASPVLTRIYGPQEFGMLAVFMGMLSLGAVIASLRYELAIPLPEKDEDAANLLALCGTVIIAGVMLIAGIVGFWGPDITRLLGVPQLAPWLWLLPIALLFTGFYQALHYFGLRLSEYGSIARTRLSRSLGTVVVQVLSFKLGGGGLVLGQAASGPIGVTTLGRAIWRKRAKTLRSITAGAMLAQARRYSNFPIWSSPGALLNTAAAQAPALALSALFSPAAAGLYALTHRVLSLPMSTVGQAVADVFFSHGAQANREGGLADLTENTFRMLAKVGVAPTVVLISSAPALFALVFGAEWRGAGELAQWLAVWFLLVFVTSPLSRVFMLTERLAELTVIQGFLLIFPLSTLIAAEAFLGSQLVPVLAVYAAANSLGYAVYLIRCLGISGVPLTAAIRAVGLSVPWALAVALPSALATLFGNDLTVLVAATAGLLVHGARLVPALKAIGYRAS